MEKMGKLESIEDKIEKLEGDIEKLKSYFSDDKITKTGVTERVGKGFKDWVGEIQKERLKRLIDDKKISFEKIVSMIPKYNFSEKMKEDLVKFKFK